MMESSMRPYDLCVRWIKSREAVRVARLADDDALSDDPVIREYSFCNVRREDDRVTRWIKENVRERFAGHPLLWLMLCACRQINWPDAIAELIELRAWYDNRSFDPTDMGHVLQARADRGDKTFTGAYIITAPSVKGARKAKHVAERTLGNLWRDRARIELLFGACDERGDYIARRPRLEEVHARLKQYDGWGDFMAYQAVVDMRFTPLLDAAEDRDRWAAAGPGTVRGLNRLAGRDLKAKPDQHVALRELRALHPRLVADSGVEMDFSDVPNVMCETDKYLRVLNGEGKPRAKYLPPSMRKKEAA